MKKIHTSHEAGILLSREEKKEIMSGFLFQLLQNSFHGIDSGKFENDFCIHCLLEYAVAYEKVRPNESEFRIVERELSKRGKFRDYQIGDYMLEDDIEESSYPIADFDKELMLDDFTFDKPISGKFNISYPFVGVIFELDVLNAKSVGDILSQISKAYVSIYNYVDATDIVYFHGIDDLVFEDSIRIYDNGTIEFHVGS